MSWFKNTLQANSKKHHTGSTVRLSLEGMEDRLALSASSFGLHAVKETSGSTAAFFRNPASDTFDEKKPDGGIIRIADAHSVTDFSAGLDLNGHAVVFAHRVNPGRGNVHSQSLWEHDDATGWHKLKEPIGMKHFAAVNGDRLYAEAVDHSFWKYVGPHTQTVTITTRRGPQTLHVPVAAKWTKLPGKIYGLDAVTQTNGEDVVFAIDANNGLQKFTRGSWQVLVEGAGLDQQRDFDSFSAGLNLNGNAVVWMTTSGHWMGDQDEDGRTDGSLAVWDSTWRRIADENPDYGIPTISATAAGQVFINQPLEDQNVLVKVDERPYISQVVIPGYIGTVTDVSAVGADDFFVMTVGGYIKEHTAAGWISYN